MNVCMYEWAFVGTHAHTHVFGNIGNERWKENFLRHNIYYDACVFFWGHYVVHLLFLGCVATHAFFMGHIFENYGLGLGLALFRLGTQMGPAMKKNLAWLGNFSKPFVQSLGFETCFKFQFGDNLAWMTIQVSNWVIQRFGSSNPNMLGMIWLGWPPKSQIG